MPSINECLPYFARAVATKIIINSPIVFMLCSAYLSVQGVISRHENLIDDYARLPLDFF